MIQEEAGQMIQEEAGALAPAETRFYALASSPVRYDRLARAGPSFAQ
jgi:hypothetical protein